MMQGLSFQIFVLFDLDLVKLKYLISELKSKY